jgi:hypothetical protein
VPTARKRFTSTVETPEEAEGPEHVVFVTVSVRVVRDDLKRGIDGVVKTLFGHVPGLIRPQVESFLRPRIDTLLGDVVRLLDVTGSGRMSITYHTPPEPSPSPRPPDASPEPTEEPGPVWVYLDRAGVAGAIEAGRVLELVSCSGPYGPWSGVMRVGGIGPVPFSELPVAFSFPGSTGSQATTTSTDGTIPWILPGITSDVHYDIDVVVDGTTMVVTISGTANERVQGQELIGDIAASAGPQTLPIEPAPEGRCEPRPTPSPTPTPTPTPTPAPTPTPTPAPTPTPTPAPPGPSTAPSPIT